MLNKNDRLRLFRLNDLLGAVPFPRCDFWGSTTAAGFGRAGYEKDMRIIVPFYKKVISGMIMEQAAQDPDNDLEEGWDYDNPDKLLAAMELWVEIRKGEGWSHVSQANLMALWNGVKNE